MKKYTALLITCMLLLSFTSTSGYYPDSIYSFHYNGEKGDVFRFSVNTNQNVTFDGDDIGNGTLQLTIKDDISAIKVDSLLENTSLYFNWGYNNNTVDNLSYKDSDFYQYLYMPTDVTLQNNTTVSYFDFLHFINSNDTDYEDYFTDQYYIIYQIETDNSTYIYERDTGLLTYYKLEMINDDVYTEFEIRTMNDTDYLEPVIIRDTVTNTESTTRSFTPPYKVRENNETSADIYAIIVMITILGLGLYAIKESWL